MANYQDLLEAYHASTHENEKMAAAQALMFDHFSENLSLIRHWPTNATLPLFNVAVKKYLEEEL